ncbi:oxidoreductase [Aeromicrobium senzhongii]|uniref:Oxidoreductase n=1 Tax=Aeromicrobium senzhongii TaxID=2663859 RepID=A0ABX6SR72_9ACTN|nr:NAD-dependent epimerase/dehydratase family protein [Aeromicrobium senzhongii]MTB88834.1 oxidoreductase [Aeromicrobium senzhongii]QNL93878.1 oxidoreductase [Aeromicrobium senzhongii]
MELLVLGGTAFLGREIALTAVARGHRVTCGARGSAEPPPGVDFVRVDRDDEDGLAPLAGHGWGGVIDVARQPGHVRRAVRDLTAAHWTLVSSGNAYADFSSLEQTEDAATLAPLVADAMASDDDYGPAKVACEEAVRAAGPAAVVRSGLIGGAGDWSGRTGYWPWRFAHPVGPEVVVPDDLDFPCAMIDVRDLAAWIVSLAERQVEGVFNATGTTTDLRSVLDAAARVAGSSARPRSVPVERLRELGIDHWMGPQSLPLWIDDADWRGFATMDTRRARAEGLVTRPLEETLADVLAWEEARTEPRPCGLTDEEERRVLTAL